MTTAPKRSVWKAFTRPSAWTMFFFGFASGLPFLLVAGTLAYWLREDGIELRNITVIASAGLAYTLKFLWAPLVDRWRLPLFGRLGQRRGWLLLAQMAVTAGLLGMSLITPSQLALFVTLVVMVAFAGATMDIAVDAYRIEIAPVEEQGALVAVYSLGYRIALIVTGALALVLADHVAWPHVYQAMAAVMLVPIAANLLAREPSVVRVRTEGWREAMRVGVVEPFADFFVRFRGSIGIALLAFILLFKISDQALVGGLIGPFYLDMGYSKTEIAAISKVYGIWIGIAGAFAGGIAVARWGIERPLLLAIVFGRGQQPAVPDPDRRRRRSRPVDAGDLGREFRPGLPRDRRGGVSFGPGQPALHGHAVRAVLVADPPAGEGAGGVFRRDRRGDRLRAVLRDHHGDHRAGAGVVLLAASTREAGWGRRHR
jgi:MFS transporter, PAT family, beta-lactamase induction signal transducer AmpG